MITNWHYDNTGDREFIRKTVRDNNYSAIDIGGGCGGVFRDCIDAVVDINPIDFECKRKFVGNINLPMVWEAIIDNLYADPIDFECNGNKYDYAICSMTLEDISNPMIVVHYLNQIAKRGVIIVPSKYRELTRGLHGPYRGFIHHHSIFNVENGVLVRYPKLNLIEQARFDAGNKHLTELIIEWEGEIPFREVNDGFLGPTHQDVEKYYDELIKS